MSDAMLPVIVNRAKINDNAIVVNTTDISDRDNENDFNLAMLSRGGGILLEFLGGDVPLGPWNP